MSEILDKYRIKRFSDIGLELKNMEEYNFKENNTAIYYFNNVKHYGECLEQIHDIKTYRNSSTKKDSWAGTATYEDALNLILKPNTPPPVDVRERLASIELKIKNNLKKKGILTDYIVESYHYDVEGEEIDIAKLIEGDPNCYLKANKKYKGHFYDLHVNFAVSWGNSIDEIVNAYSKIIATVIILEQKGYRIRLIASGVFRDSSSSNIKNIVISMPIKHYDTAIDINDIVKILFPSFLRRLAFKFLEVRFQKTLSSGYGTAVHSMKGVVTTDSSLKEDSLLNGILDKLYDFDEREMHGKTS